MAHTRKHSNASRRVIARILELSHGVTDPQDGMMEKIILTYRKAGGRWAEFFNSNPKHIKLLKSVVKAVVKESNSDE